MHRMSLYKKNTQSQQKTLSSFKASQQHSWQHAKHDMLISVFKSHFNFRKNHVRILEEYLKLIIKYLYYSYNNNKKK